LTLDSDLFYVQMLDLPKFKTIICFLFSSTNLSYLNGETSGLRNRKMFQKFPAFIRARNLLAMFTTTRS